MQPAFGLSKVASCALQFCLCVYTNQTQTFSSLLSLWQLSKKKKNHPTTIRNQRCTSQCSYSLPWLWIEISLFFVFSSFDWCDNSTLESVVVSSQIRITKDSSRQFGFQASCVCRGKASWGRYSHDVQSCHCRSWSAWLASSCQLQEIKVCEPFGKDQDLSGIWSQNVTFWPSEHFGSLLQVMGHKKWYVSIFFYLTFMLWTFTVQDGKGGFKIGGVG